MVKTFSEVNEFTNLDIENDDTYLVFSDGSRCKIEESPFVPHEKKDEEETPKTDETTEQQPDTESTTDAGSEDSTSWTQKVSGFFKQLFKK